MPKKKHKPEEIVAKLRQADGLISQGQKIADVIRQIGVSEVTYYRWRQEFGGLKTEQIKRLKDLELENGVSWKLHQDKVNKARALVYEAERKLVPPIIDASTK